MPSDILELLADAADGVYAVDMNQRIIFWNRSAERVLGYRAAEVLGKRCYHVIGGLSAEEPRVCATNCAVILWARQGRVAPSHTVLTQTRHGQHKWLSVTHVLLPAPKRELSTLVHLFHDVTEQVEAKQLLGRLNSFLAQAPQVSVPAGLVPPDEGLDGVDPLSPREREVLHLLAQGLGTRAIAEKLVISSATVRNHIQRVLSKLGAHNRLEAVAAAFHRGPFA